MGFATANAVLFGLFLLGAIAFSKIAFYLCTSNQPKGVARSFKDFPPASHMMHTESRSKSTEDGRDLMAKIKGTPAACVQTENQFIFIYEME